MTADTTAPASMYRSTAQELTEPMRRFLAGQPFLTLGTQNPDGSVHLVPTWFLFDDGKFFIATWSGSRKARNADARGQATVTVDDRTTAEWVSASGPAHLLRGEESAAVNDRLRRRYMTVQGIEAIGALLEQAEDATIVVTPQRWTAWDYQSTVLTALQDAGASLDDMDTWYLP